MIDLNNQARYFALLQVVAESSPPNPEWLEEILAFQSVHPDWPTTYPPADVNPSTVPLPPAPVPPRAAVPLKPGRVAIDLTGDNRGEEYDTERIMLKVLEILGARFCVFQSAGRLLELQIDPGKHIKFLAREVAMPRMAAINATRAWSIAGEQCRFTSRKKVKGGGDTDEPQATPEWLGRAIVSRSNFPYVPVISALAQAPTLRVDGALIQEPGYDTSTGIFLHSDLQVSLPDNPTQDDARDAATLLLDLLCDFEFTNPAAKSVWLAGLLSVACRHTFDGPAPLFIFDASKRGSGKSLLADMISLIVTGHSAPRMAFIPNDIEMDKRITSLGLAGDQFVLLDNITCKLASPSLDMALTSDSYRGRILSKNETPSLPMKMVWFATGNGMIIGADTARRSLLARIEPSCDHPEYRDGPRPGVKWKYKLPDYCLRHRAKLLSCGLTILSAYIRAGRPAVMLGTNTGPLEMGSYNKWSETIRAAIVWAGALDPCQTIQDVQDADLDEIALRRMVKCWPAGDGVIVTTAALVKQAEVSFGAPNASANEQWRNALLEWLPAKPGAALPTPRDLGYALRNIKGAIIEGYKIESEKHTVNGIPWKRVFVGGKSPEKNEQKTPSSGPSLVSI